MDGPVGRLVPKESESPEAKPLEFAKGKLNTEEQVLVDNIKINIRRGLPQVRPYEEQINDAHIALVGGGPSLGSQEVLRTLHRHAELGGPVIATNNAAQWLVGQQIVPQGHVIVDARAFNKRFIDPPIAKCKYFLGSQVSPELFDFLLERECEVYIWHGGTSKLCFDDLNEVYGMSNYYVIKVGSTVMLAGIWVLWLLGFRWIDLFGFDSCLSDGQHHAYEQPENDKNAVLEVKVNGRLFYVHPWMWAQFQDFLKFAEILGDKVNLRVHGEGLISYALEQLDQVGYLHLEES